MPEVPVKGWDRVERGLRVRYHRHVRPYLSDRAVERVTHWKRRFFRQVAGPPPRPPVGRLELSGLVYTSIFNLGDHRKNPRDMLSAYLLAFRDRADVTLVLKLASNPRTEWAEIQGVQGMLDELGLPFQCRVVAITDYLSEPQMRALYAASTYYVNTSRAEGACLPLQRALAAGRPAIAPRHTAMADYMDGEVGFVVESHPEPTHWPHDPQRRFETTWHRLVWSNLKEQYLRSAQVAEHGRPTYLRMAAAGRTRMERTASREVAEHSLRKALSHLNQRPWGAMDW
jgi:glycosyltransferase involved in cell wall biosynthesis